MGIEIAAAHIDGISSVHIHYGAYGFRSEGFLCGDRVEVNTSFLIDVASAKMAQMFIINYIDCVDKNIFLYTYDFGVNSVTFKVSQNSFGIRSVDIEKGFYDTSGLIRDLRSKINKLIF